MTDNEKLIEEAANAIRDALWEPSCRSAAEAAFAVFEKAHTPTGNEKWRQVSPAFETTREAYEHIAPTDAPSQAAPALEVEGDAPSRDTPTDDDLHALGDIIEHVQTMWEADRHEYIEPLAEFTARGILAAGFRRSVVPEPSAGQVNDVLVLLEDAIDNIDYPGADTLEWIGKAKAHAATLARWARPEPQGEPSDALLEAVGQAIRAELRPERKDAGPLYLDHDVYEYENLARVALRAAGVGGAR